MNTFLQCQQLQFLACKMGRDLQIPGILALVAAAVSIVSKEAMFWYTKINAARIDSSALLADAWHHRSDAFSSVGALIGIAGGNAWLSSHGFHCQSGDFCVYPQSCIAELHLTHIPYIHHFQRPPGSLCKAVQVTYVCSFSVFHAVLREKAGNMKRDCRI